MRSILHFLKKIKPYAWIVNRSLEKALISDYDNVLLLNSDTIIHQHCLQNLVSISKYRTVLGIIGGFQCKYESSWVIPNQWMTTMLNNNSKWVTINLGNSCSRLLYSSYVQGACMLISKNVIRQIGLFDERFTLFYEETEYCRRAREEGFKITTLKEAKVQHFEGGSWKQNFYLRFKRDVYYLSNQIIFESTERDSLKKGFYRSIFSIIKKQIFTIYNKKDSVRISLFFYPIVVFRVFLKLRFLFTLRKNTLMQYV